MSSQHINFCFLPQSRHKTTLEKGYQSHHFIERLLQNYSVGSFTVFFQWIIPSTPTIFTTFRLQSLPIRTIISLTVSEKYPQCLYFLSKYNETSKASIYLIPSCIHSRIYSALSRWQRNSSSWSNESLFLVGFQLTNFHFPDINAFLSTVLHLIDFSFLKSSSVSFPKST